MIEKSQIGLRLARGVFWTMAGSLISRSLMMIATVLVARILGKTGYGELGMIQSTVGLFGIFAGFGLGLTATKHVAEYRQSDPERAGRIICLSGMLAMLTGGVMSLGLFLSSPWLAEHTINAPHLGRVLRIGAFILFISALNGAQTGALSGFEAFKTIARVNLFTGLISFPILICGAYFGGLAGAVWALVVNLCLNWLLNHLSLRTEAKRFNVPFSLMGSAHKWSSLSLFRIPTQLRGALAERKVIWSFSIPATISGLLVIPVVWFSNTILVNLENGYSEFGLFNAANQWRHMAIVIPNILGSVMLPILSETYSRKDSKEFHNAFLINLRMTWVMALPATAAIIGFSKPLVDLFGSQYNDALLIMPPLLASAFLFTINNVVGTAIVGSGRMWIGSLFNLFWGVTLIVSTIYLAPIYGGKGLAYSYFISYAFHTIWQMAYVEKRLAPDAIIGQWKLILFTLITLIPIFFLVEIGGLSYIWNGAVVLLSFVPLIVMVRHFLKKSKKY